MIIIVSVHPSAQTEGIVHQGGHILKVKVKAPAKRGLANKALIKLLAAHFNIDPAGIKIKQGLNRRNKIIEIPDNHDAEEMFNRD